MTLTRFGVVSLATKSSTCRTLVRHIRTQLTTSSVTFEPITTNDQAIVYERTENLSNTMGMGRL
jgi:hypothetical protein